MNIPVFYEDAYLLVCVKPQGVLSQSDSKGKIAMPELLSQRCGSEIYPVHRLDREVSGIMVYAKTQKAAAGLSQLVSNHEKFVKTYFAVVEGIPEPNGVLEDLLFHDRFKNKTYVVDRMRGGVKAAKLSYETLAVKEGGAVPLSLVRIRLYTGRSHQIRVQFASRGMPLSGDKRYGAVTGGDIALFSGRLQFDHPLTRMPIDIQAQPKRDGAWAYFAPVFEGETE